MNKNNSVTDSVQFTAEECALYETCVKNMAHITFEEKA